MRSLQAYDTARRAPPPVAEPHARASGQPVSKVERLAMDAAWNPVTQRYSDEVRMHRDMGLNLLRVWGGGIAERPGFFDATDEAGLLVWHECLNMVQMLIANPRYTLQQLLVRSAIASNFKICNAVLGFW